MVQMGLQQLFYMCMFYYPPLFLLIFALDLWEKNSMKRKKKPLTDQLTTTKNAMLNVGIFYNIHSIILI